MFPCIIQISTTWLCLSPNKVAFYSKTLAGNGGNYKQLLIQLGIGRGVYVATDSKHKERCYNWSVVILSMLVVDQYLHLFDDML